MSHSREGLRGRAPVPARAIRKALEERRRTDPTVTEEDIIAEISAKVQGQPEPKPKPASDFEPVTHHEPTPELLEQVKRQQQETQATNQTVVKEPARPERKVPEPTRRTENRPTAPKQVPIQTQLQEKKESTREPEQPSPPQPPRDQQVTETKETVSKPKRTTIKGPPRKPVVRDETVVSTPTRQPSQPNDHVGAAITETVSQRFQVGTQPERFIDLEGVFHNGTFVNNQHIQIRRFEESLLASVRNNLLDLYEGLMVTFPAFTHKVKPTNKVFSQNTSLVRYTMFQGMFHEDGRHVQYAKQWLLTAYPNIFEDTFNPESVTVTSDELDVYVLVYLSYARYVQTVQNEEALMRKGVSSGVMHEQTQKMDDMVVQMNQTQRGIMSLYSKLSERFDRIERMNMTTLLDRMGLLELPQGYPKDVDSLIAILESNRDEYDHFLLRLQQHEIAESDRKKRL